MMDPCLLYLHRQTGSRSIPSIASEWQQLLDGYAPRNLPHICLKNHDARGSGSTGMTVYIRGLIEFTNYCRNNCYYCGIRSGNTHAHRYRLTKEEILSCCEDRVRARISDLSSCRAVKTPMVYNRPVIRRGAHNPDHCTRTARSPFPLERPQRKSTSSFLMPAPTVSFCAMRPTTQSTTRQLHPAQRLSGMPTDSNASGT